MNLLSSTLSAIALATTLSLAACAQPKAPPKPEPYVIPPPPAVEGIHAIELGKLVGTYAGQVVCAASVAQTRSDWVLKYLDRGLERCIFVSGGLPLGVVPPPSTQSVGIPVAIDGELVTLHSGRTYFVMKK